MIWAEACLKVGIDGGVDVEAWFGNEVVGVEVWVEIEVVGIRVEVRVGIGIEGGVDV
jgi:hypothetical protein